MKYSIPLLTALTTIALAETLLVPSQYPSIQNAINAAQDGDTVLVSPDEYEGPINFEGKNIVVSSTAGAGSTLIRTSRNYHCVSIAGGQDSTAVLEGFTVSNQVSDNEVSRDTIGCGGGLYIVNASPTIRNNIITDCVAESQGGGLFLENSSTLMSGCIISNNTAMFSGGVSALSCGKLDHPLRIIDCTITGNQSTDMAGGLSCNSSSSIVIINNYISDNYTYLSGGGILLNYTNALLFGNTISGNDAFDGGGISIRHSEPTIIGNIIVRNTADYGAGIYQLSGLFEHLENNTIANNAASVRGGGLLCKDGSISIVNSILWGNIAPTGSQILMDNADVSVEYCDVEYGEDSVYNFASSTLNWGPGNIDIDPEFETGPFGDYHLPWGTPCVDAGNPASEYNDPEDPFNPGYALWPAMGLIRNDMGAFGGGGVDYWLSVEEEELSPTENGLPLKSFPNPFSSSCTVCYQLDEASQVVLQVFDLSGRLVETLVDKAVPSGMHSEHFDGSGLCPGVYLIRLVAVDVSTSRRCIVLR
ncbi:MAG: T9SS type A sorting domain-containing protein [Candidatus Aegiribacteria sp.]|nr:T9SS type A sorting domain-containing protein [Candidatus Aegiribacteria sp.]